MENKIIVAVSGGFDPVHVGHVRLFKEAKKLGDKLVVILNNDNWLRKKKGRIFMPEDERKEIISALTDVDEVVLTSHPPDPDDMSVCAELERIHPHIFSNGGDRTRDNIPEFSVCRKINCRMEFNVGAGGKIQSSSWLLGNYLKKS
ncbi:MAG: Glycerol-3-phosphate cytidylyltransferase [Parcubacteria group bacterium GW2011_GWA2_45_30]|nr:MAG: Glycerol-3-phosphate cytidylyltransferase [Parcubacteria group bacterium GW2011_GWA2_45_30]